MLPAFAPLALAALAALVPALHRRLGRDTGWPLAAVFLVLAVLFAAQAPAIADGGPIEVAWPWLDSVDASFRLRLDGLSLQFSLVILGIGALVMAYCARYFGRGPHAWFYTVMVLFALSMLVLVLADDVLLLFAAWELTTLCSFFLIGGTRPGPAPAAFRALLTTAVGGLGLLAGLVVLSVHTGTTRLSGILADPAAADGSPASTTAIALIMFAAATKSAQLPFHFWLPDAMVAATPVSAYLHAAAMVKAGVYLLMRCAQAFADDPLWSGTLITVGLATAIVGALLALQHHDLKVLLAYSTVSQLGFLVALAGIGTVAALAAAAVHVLAHALFKATLFMLVGVIDHQMGSRDIRELTGLRRAMPVTAAVTGLAAMSLAGLPPLLGYVSKEQMYRAFAQMPGPEWVGAAVVAAGVAAAALTFAYGLRIVSGAFGGPTEQRRLREPSPAFLAPAAVAALAGLGLGLTASALSPFIERAAVAARAEPAAVHLSLWHGLSPSLAMTAAAFAVGTGLFLARDPVDRVLQRLRLPFDGVGAFNRCYGAATAAGVRTAGLTQRGRPVRHLPVPLLAVAAIAAAFAFTGVDAPERPEPVTRGTDWILVAVLAVTVAAATTRRSRLAAVTAVGLSGLTVAMWYLRAGAPDLAITQVLFEVMIVVVAVMVLRALPRRFHRTGRVRGAAAAALAVAAGVAAGGGVYYLTGRRGPSEVSDYLLEHTEPETGGSNAVNAVLVDFRALDTLGEVTVLAAAALGVAAIADQARPRTRPRGEHRTGDSLVVLEVVRRLLVPVFAVASIYLLVRGHYAPGGGFIAGLVAGGALALARLARPPTGRPQFPPVETPLLSGGLAVAVGTGLASLAAAEPFLTPLHAAIDFAGAHLSLSTSVVFDVGVYLIVLGTTAAALNRLAYHETDPPGPRRAVEPVR
ncbi:hydrogen gas-evolving membrane-bound hydrogenase subunit E [Glycomyces xiaoerkulensis]|uniref:hydrogen gas-evolving membrane-bound hydrogenase subunit E n=1 Tax=Glycomyces xiaoerkulensis TaxID=2038139 RepID=UPI000C25E870|nr:hydrogen gas-evolving membrane-bound hydrogenase subunit E [Glycomyces xiaoerkulensis]